MAKKGAVPALPNTIGSVGTGLQHLGACHNGLLQLLIGK